MVSTPPSRNALCPCGSDLRYKHCHGGVKKQRSVPANPAPLDTARALLMQGKLVEAVNACEAQIATAGADEATLRVLGDAAMLLDDTDKVRSTWHAVLDVAPEDPEALFHLGNQAQSRGDSDASVALFERARAQAPNHAELRNNLGLALETVGRPVDAEQEFREACKIADDLVGPVANLAQNLYKQRRFSDALQWFERLVSRFDVTTSATWERLARCQYAVGDLVSASLSLERALAIETGSAMLFTEFGLLNLEMKRFNIARDALERSLSLEPANVRATSAFLSSCQNLVIWENFETTRTQLIDSVLPLDERSSGQISPFDFLSICDDPVLQNIVTNSWAQTTVPVLSERPLSKTGVRLRLGIASYDLYDHPVGRLIVDLVECLDRERFHVSLFAFGPDRDDATRRRLHAAADSFHTTSSLDVATHAALVRDVAVDILVDLGGFTRQKLVELFATRPAPLQIQFLGYTGTMASPAYDYIVTDRHCIPPEAVRSYSETPLYIEPCYLPSDSQRELTPEPLVRAMYGLPENAIVLCAFANRYKILPGMFNIWMRLLTEHKLAVLWLRDFGEDINSRLTLEASSRGVSSGRILFAPHEPVPRYLARFCLADLFLDTTPFGSHTTVNDALFAGLPVLTQDGASFAGRSSASQVIAVGLQELVAADALEYHSIAHRLLSDVTELRVLTKRLQINRETSPLFDTKGYARKFGDAILKIANSR